MKFFKKSSENIYNTFRYYLEDIGFSAEDVESTAPLLLEIVHCENDFKHAKDKVFYPFYQGLSFPAIFLMEINRAFHTKFNDGKESAPMRLAMCGFDNLGQFFQNKNIKQILCEDPQVIAPNKLLPSQEYRRFDRAREVTPHITSVSPSLFQSTPEENVLYFFASGKNATLNAQILFDKILAPAFEQLLIPKERAQRYMSVFYGYRSKISRAILQIMIRKDAINDLVYVSKKMGVPFNLNLKTMAYFKDTDNFLMNLRQGYTGVEKYFADHPELKNTEIHKEFIDNKQYWQDTMQFRVLVSSKAFWKRSLCISHIFYEHKIRHIVEQMRKDIDVLTNEDMVYYLHQNIEARNQLGADCVDKKGPMNTKIIQAHI